MRFDNRSRMQQLDGILHPKKSLKGCTSKAFKEDGSRTSSHKSRKKPSDTSTYAGSTAYSTGVASVSRCSVSSHGSRSRRSARPCLLGCKDVVTVQQSWGQLKAAQTTENNIGGNILKRYYSFSNKVPPERMESLSKLLVDTIDAIVSSAGPNLFEEDFECLRLIWIEEKLDPCHVSKVMLEGLRSSTVEKLFSENTVKAWENTVVRLINSWGHLN